MMVKIAFTDFWDGFDIYENFITKVLRQFTPIEVIDVKNMPQRKYEVRYLFCSGFSYDFLDFDCIRVFYTGENCFPDLNLYDYAIGFEYAEIGDRYLRMPLPFAYYQDTLRLAEKRKIDNTSYANRDKFCATVVSNGVSADQKRDFLFDRISEYKSVDSGGRYRNNIGVPEGVEDKICFLENYRFSLAFENVSHPGYFTEKIVESFAAGTIPIYWGDPKIQEFFNEEAFINCMNFEKVGDLINHIKRIDENNELYEKMIKAPILKNNTNNIEVEIEEYEKRLLYFLSNIINQDYELAYRRNKSGWCYNYEKDLVRRIDYSERWKNEVDKKNDKTIFLERGKIKSMIKKIINIILKIGRSFVCENI